MVYVIQVTYSWLEGDILEQRLEMSGCVPQRVCARGVMSKHERLS